MIPVRSTRMPVLCALGLGLLFAAHASAQTPPAPQSAAQRETLQLVAAADTFLASLDDKQRASVLYKFDDDVQRANWSNFPTGFVPRGGVSLKQLSPAQRTAAMALISAAFSENGVRKIHEIMEADELTRIDEAAHPNRGPPHGPPPGSGPDDGPRGPRGNGPNGAPPGSGPDARRGPPPHRSADQMFGKDLYFISILGTPSTQKPWMLQFGGHHLALNLTVAGEAGVLTPTLTGAQPALYKVKGKTVRPLGAENDKAIALLESLDDKQRKQAVLNYRVADLVLGPGQDGKTIEPEGLKGSAMNDAQRALLIDLISEWSGIAHEAAAAARMAEIKATLGETWFAWSGPTNAKAGTNIEAYYRIQGPTLVIEFAPQRGEPSQHIHTMYRDPTNDYGRKLTAK